MTRTERPGTHGPAANTHAGGSERGGSERVAAPGRHASLVALAAVAAHLYVPGAVPPGAARFGGAVARTSVDATRVVALAGPTVRRGSDGRQSVEGGPDTDGDADPAVLSLLAEPCGTVEGTHRRLRALERLLRQRGDRRAVFLTVCARVTGEVAAAIERGAFEGPAWVADYLVRFADRYRQALLDFETGRTARLPTARRLAFRAAEREGTGVLQHVALGVNAYVTFDLAFALRAAGVGGDRRARYADHERINLVLWRLVDETLDRLAERYAPGIRVPVDAAGPLLDMLWLGGLVLGRECAWWVALVMAESGTGYPARLDRWFLATASTTVARAVLAPTARPASVRPIRSAARRFDGRRL